MLLRSVSKHVREQNWTAIGIDLVIVVVGVFIGIQVSNWNDERVSHHAERAFIEAVRDEIGRNIADSQGFVDMLTMVREHGYLALESFDAEASCQQDCWARLVEFFFASQWIDVRTNQAIYEEIKRSGLPRDLELKATLTRYYGTTEQISIIAEQLPEYRKLVRSIIPAQIQHTMWVQCLDVNARQQTWNPDCEAAVSNAEASIIIDDLRSYDEIPPTLTAWMSTIDVVIVALNSQNKDGQMVIDEIERFLEVN